MTTVVREQFSPKRPPRGAGRFALHRREPGALAPGLAG